ncbi:MAG: hypothetical protein HQM13_07595 [SAR324 cluster bacterium]|nr:hypothetical protein [SAR324 cluster bacterium]
MTRSLFASALVAPIDETFEAIGGTLEKLIFEKIYAASQRLLEDPVEWQAKLDALREIDLFADTSTFDLMNVAADMEEMFFKKDEAFLTQDEPVKGVYLLKDKARVFLRGVEKPVVIRNGIFGEEACVMEVEAASATVKTSQEGLAFYIPRKKFLLHTKNIPGLQEKVFQIVVDRAKFEQEVAQKEKALAEEQRQLTQEVLDHIGQGSFSINQAGEIGNFSKVAKDYLNRRELAGAPFADIAFRKNRKALREYYRALNMLFGGNEFDPEVILSMLPDEVTINKRIFKLFYFFVQDSKGYVMSVFVRMEEVTLERKLAAKEEQNRRIHEKMQQNIGGFMTMLDNINNSNNLIEQFAEEYIDTEKQPDSDHIGALMRNLHGSKGLSGQFEIESLKDVLHELEDCLRGIDQNGIMIYIDRFNNLLMKLQAEYMHAVSFKENLGEKIVEILEGVSFTQTEYLEMKQAVIEGDFQSLRPLVLSKTNVPPSKIIENWETDIHRLAESLDKAIDLKLETQEGLFIPKELAQTLNVELGHLYRNCVDHGIESKSRRQELGKNEIGSITVKVYQKVQTLVLVIKDDGAGMDTEKIVEIARNNPNLSQKLVSHYVDTGKFWKILFLPGFSAAGKVTKLSGRGVGLDAVQAAIRNLGGNIVMASEPGKGSVFFIEIPLSLL